jgi:hypothetical protein
MMLFASQQLWQLDRISYQHLKLLSQSSRLVWYVDLIPNLPTTTYDLSLRTSTGRSVQFTSVDSSIDPKEVPDHLFNSHAYPESTWIEFLGGVATECENAWFLLHGGTVETASQRLDQEALANLRGFVAVANYIGNNYNDLLGTAYSGPTAIKFIKKIQKRTLTQESFWREFRHYIWTLTQKKYGTPFSPPEARTMATYPVVLCDTKGHSYVVPRN